MRVHFDEPSHTYTDTQTNQDYISVTTLIGLYTPPFDTDYWATYKAVKDVLEPVGLWFTYKRKAGGWEGVVDFYKRRGAAPYDTGIEERKQWYIQKWKEDSDKACELGTARHKEKEIEILGQEVIKKKNVDHTTHSGDIEVFKGVENGIFAELLIYDTEYHVAGQADVIYKTGNQVVIKDYKTNKKITNEPFNNERMLPPVDELYDTTFNHYMLQLSTYGYLLERQGFKIQELEIIHLNRETGQLVTTIKMPYRPDLVKLMIEDYLSQQSHSGCISDSNNNVITFK